METKRLEAGQINEAAQILRQGGLVAFPTETVYGLGALATDEEAVKRVYQAKGRPSDNPLIVHIASIDDLQPFVDEISPVAQTLMDACWPGSLTMIFKIKPGSLSKTVTGGLDTCAFRMPSHPLTLDLIKSSGPLVGPSANTSGKPSPTTADHVYHDLQGKIEAVLDGGASVVGVESTVIDVSNPHQVTILRPGKWDQGQLEQLVSVPVVYDNHLIGKSETPKAPGMKYKHYAPDVSVVIVNEPDQFAEAIDSYQGQKIGLLASADIIRSYQDKIADSYSLSEERDINAATQNLFAGLRALDYDGLDVILAEGYPSSDGLGIAYMNRLQKSAGQQFFMG